jgi:hypothetical protein
MASVTYSSGTVIPVAWLNEVNTLIWTGAWPTPLPLSNVTNITMTGNLSVTGPSSTIGYGTGSGGTVTQLTSKSTTVNLNKASGQIIMNNAALASGATIAFICNSTVIGVNDNIICTLAGPVGGANYRIFGSIWNTGQMAFSVTNITGGPLSEAVVINFSILKGAVA